VSGGVQRRRHRDQRITVAVPSGLRRELVITQRLRLGDEAWTAGGLHQL